MESFLTGSTVYGNPTEDSDVDLVVFVTPKTKEDLIALSDKGKIPCKFGKLNLIFATTEQEWEAWKEATEECLKNHNGASKEIHKQIHEEIRMEHGVDYLDDSGDEKSTEGISFDDFDPDYDTEIPY